MLIMIWKQNSRWVNCIRSTTTLLIHTERLAIWVYNTFLAKNPDHYGVFLETAHPIKFRDIVEETLGTTLKIPTQIQQILNKIPEKTSLSGYNAFKDYLLSQAV